MRNANGSWGNNFKPLLSVFGKINILSNNTGLWVDFLQRNVDKFDHNNSIFLSHFSRRKK